MANEYNHFPQVIETLSKEADRLSETMAGNMKEKCIDNAPFLTGHLQGRIRVEHPSNGSHEVVSDTGDATHREYAAYQEYGTRYQHAQPYMLPGYVQGLAALQGASEACGRRIELSATSGAVI